MWQLQRRAALDLLSQQNLTKRSSTARRRAVGSASVTRRSGRRKTDVRFRLYSERASHAEECGM